MKGACLCQRLTACLASEPVHLHRASAGEAVAYFFWHGLWQQVQGSLLRRDCVVVPG